MDREISMKELLAGGRLNMNIRMRCMIELVKSQ